MAQITDSSFSSSRLKELPYRFAARIKHIESVAGWERQLELRNLRHGFFWTIFAEDPETFQKSLIISDDVKIFKIPQSFVSKNM